MPDHASIGSRIRDRRQVCGLRQAELAAGVGISPSYLNLIEHGRRRIAGKLLADIARALDLDPTALGEASDGNRLRSLRAAVAAVPDLARPHPEVERVQEFADRFPGWAALVAAQAARVEVLEGRVTELSGRLSYDPDLAQALHQVISGVTAIRATSGILAENPDLDRDWQNRFLGNIRADSEALAQASRALVRFLEAPATTLPPSVSAVEEAERWLNARDHHIPEVESGGLPVDLPDGAAGDLVRAWVRRYAEDARALPLDAFSSAAQQAAHDPAPLARRFGVSLPQVLRRLAALPAGMGHPPMGLAICDASGTITHLKPLEGVTLPRAAGCPLWPLFEALARPGQGVRAHAVLPGQNAPRFLCHAVASPREVPDWDSPGLIEGTMLLTPAAPEVQPTERHVGPTCRICPRRSCPARREPSILRGEL
ncbi:helix-turn-helix domain-containing protein [Rubellimicrobium rubrum]|uniref:Helix-turn-helix domain-containing protein n=1 Tax=Rubellimicrobium rubrum TaxID=2585369 RepID=A0A5C4N3M2_9RHOB|nr:helix-turn-helix transcriptional regulator [Rubellimicrobium rubrum]TNC52896.1 helix-turn-helix domain-containing protein [Rubellimicrobium rubrum]